MQTIKFSIPINAPRQKVWNTMLEDKTYRLWTKAFYPGSYYEGSWEKGMEIRFLARSENGTLGGMYSRIKDAVLHQFISIEHLGMVVNGEVDTTSEQVKKWAPSFENYTFTEDRKMTTVTIEMQVEDEYKDMFDDMWPLALKELKALSES